MILNNKLYSIPTRALITLSALAIAVTGCGSGIPGYVPSDFQYKSGQKVRLAEGHPFLSHNLERNPHTILMDLDKQNQHWEFLPPEDNVVCTIDRGIRLKIIYPEQEGYRLDECVGESGTKYLEGWKLGEFLVSVEK